MYVAVIQGSAFLWHQVRCMMAIIFLIGREREDISLIDIMLSKDFIENNKLNYEIASDIPLILTNCQYEGVTFSNNKANLSEIYDDLREIFEKNLIDLSITSNIINFFGNILKPIYLEEEPKEKDAKDIWKFIDDNSKKNKGKYTKLLNIKRNKNN